MPRFDDVTKGVAIGLGVAILIPVAIRTLAPVLKPVARSALKGGVRVVERGRELIAETSEMVEDLVAETHAEMRDERFYNEDDNEHAPMDDTGVDTAEDTASHSERTNVRNIVNE